eukprot:3685928-Prymnesium_polylepis.1
MPIRPIVVNRVEHRVLLALRTVVAWRVPADSQRPTFAPCVAQHDLHFWGIWDTWLMGHGSGGVCGFPPSLARRRSRASENRIANRGHAVAFCSTHGH